MDTFETPVLPGNYMNIQY